jgi:hypothetical protein
VSVVALIDDAAVLAVVEPKLLQPITEVIEDLEASVCMRTKLVDPLTKPTAQFAGI